MIDYIVHRKTEFHNRMKCLAVPIMCISRGKAKIGLSRKNERTQLSCLIPAADAWMQ